MRSLCLLTALAACTPSDDSATPGGTPTGTPGTEVQMTVSCAVQEANRLRYDCEIASTTPGAIDVSWQAEGGPLRQLSTETTGTEHHITLYAMKSGRELTVHFDGPDGRKTRKITPDPIPSFIQSDIEIEGQGSTPVLLSLPCIEGQALAIIDVDGEVLWYQMYELEGPRGPVDGGYEFTRDGTVLAAFGPTITEITLAGEEVGRWTAGTDFPDAPLHHDVHRGANGLTYALFAEEVAEADGSYVMDGVFVFDGPDLVATWHLADHIQASGGTGGIGFWNGVFPGATDYSHGNSVVVDADGSMYLSLRWLSAGLRIDGDPDSPTFGAIDWQLVGDPASPLVGDFTLSSAVGGPADFIGQHHVNPTPDGRLALFDNRKTGSSRGLILELDEGLGTAEIQESWDIGWICSAQGANHVLPNGNALLTCATSGLVAEYAPGLPDPVWSLNLTCGVFTMVPRGVPAPI